MSHTSAAEVAGWRPVGGKFEDVHNHCRTLEQRRGLKTCLKENCLRHRRPQSLACSSLNGWSMLGTSRLMLILSAEEPSKSLAPPSAGTALSAGEPHLERR